MGLIVVLLSQFGHLNYKKRKKKKRNISGKRKKNIKKYKRQKKSFGGKTYNKKKKHNKEKKQKKKAKKEEARNREKNIVAGKALLQSTMLCVGSYSVFPTPFIILIVFFKKIGSGISRGVLKLTRRPQL